MRTDLHIHTNMSDGCFGPSQVVRMAASGGLDTLAISDHNTIAGLLEARRTARELGVRLIPGVELTCTVAGVGEVHVLGYSFDATNAALIETFDHIRALKRTQISRIIDRLNEEGISIAFDEVEREAQSCYVGRQHLARALLSKRAVGSRYDIFQQYIGSDGRAYVPLDPFPPETAIGAIHEAGGLAVLAHPSIGLVDMAIKALIKAGLDGIEIYRPASQGSEQLYMEMVAEDLGLLATGGSDWHGFPSDPPIGSFWAREELIRPFLERIEKTAEG